MYYYLLHSNLVVLYQQIHLLLSYMYLYFLHCL